MKRAFQLAALAVVVSADLSVLKFRTGNKAAPPVEITWDGTSLMVPQLCRASECVALADADVKQAARNGAFANDVAAVSARAQDTAKGLVTANKAVIKQDEANQAKFNSYASSTIAHGKRQREDFASDDADIAGALRLETAARKQAVLSLEKSVDEETKALRKRHATLEKELLKAVHRLGTFENAVAIDVSALTAVDTQDRAAAKKLGQESQTADGKLAVKTAALQAKLKKQHTALLAVDTALRAVDADALAANAAAHKALRALDAKLAQRVAAAEAKHDKDVAALEANDRTLVAADNVAKKRVASLALDVKARDSLLAAKVAKAVSDHDEKVALLKLADARLNAAGRADKASLLKLAESVVAEDAALAKRIAELRQTHDSDVAALQAADAKLTAADAVAKNILTKDFYIAQAAQTDALGKTIQRIRASHRAEFDGLFKEIAGLEATDRAVVTEFTGNFGALDRQLKGMWTKHAKVVAELRAEDAAVGTANAKLKVRHAQINLSLASLNADLSAAIKKANAEHAASIETLKAADVSRGAASAEQVKSLTKVVAAANAKLEQTIDAAEKAHTDAVRKFKAGDAVLEQADVDAKIRADALNIAYMAQDAKLLQRLEALKATHAAEVAKLDREDAAIVRRIVTMTKLWEGETAALGSALGATVAKDSAAAAAKLREASAARASIRKEVETADATLARNVAKARADFAADLNGIGKAQAALGGDVAADSAKAAGADATLEKRVGASNGELALIKLSIANADASLADELRRARADHAAEVARATAAEAANAKAIAATVAHASSSNADLEDRVNKSIASEEEANRARQEKLGSELDAAAEHLRARIQDAETKHAQELARTRAAEGALDDADVLANLRLKELGLVLASEDAKLAARIKAEQAKRESAVELLKIAESGHASTDKATRDRLAELRGTFHLDFHSVESAQASRESKLDVLTKKVDDLNDRYQAEIAAAEKAAADDNAKLHVSITAAIGKVDAASHSRDADLKATAAANRAAVMTAQATLRASTEATNAAIENEAKANNVKVEAEKSKVERHHELRTVTDVATMGVLHAAFEGTMLKVDKELSKKIEDAALEAEDEILVFGLEADDARNEMAREVRAAAREARHDAQHVDVETAELTDKHRAHNLETAAKLGRVHVDDKTGLDKKAEEEHATKQEWLNFRDGSLKGQLQGIDDSSVKRAKDLETKSEESSTALANNVGVATGVVAKRTSDAHDALDEVQSQKDRVGMEAEARKGAVDDALVDAEAKERSAQTSRDELARVMLARQHAAFHEQHDVLQRGLDSNLERERREEDRGDKMVHTTLTMDLKATTDAATNNLRRQAATTLAAETARREAADEELLAVASNEHARARKDILASHSGLREALHGIDNALTAEIAKAKAEHDAEVAALHEADRGLAAAIMARVGAAEERIADQEGEQSVRTEKLLSAAKAKSAAADAHAAKLLQNLQEQSDLILGVGNPSTAACEAATIGLCNVRDQLHGGVAGECDLARSSGGWCSFRCNNGVFRGEDGCKAKATNTKRRTCPAGFGMTKEGTATTDRECEACPTGSFSTTDDDSACEAVNACGAGEYETLAPTAAADRTCASHTECASHEYEAKAPGVATDRECQQKVCHCVHGTHAMGDACPEHGEPKCVSCASHFHLADGDRQCNADSCNCKHGTAATGVACTAHAATQCTSCHVGFHLVGQATAAGQDCTANVCTCAGGKAATGTACTTDGAAICTSCGAGFRLLGSSCVAMNACTHNPCLNGGLCVDSPHNTGFDRRLTQASDCPLTTNVQTVKVQNGNMGSCSCPGGYRKLELGAAFSDTRRRRSGRRRSVRRRRNSGDKEIQIAGEKDATWVDWDKWINPKPCTSTDHSHGTCAKICVPTNDGQLTDPVCSYDLTNPSTGRCRCPGKAGKVSFGPTRADTRRRRRAVARRRRNTGMAKLCNANDNECTWYDWTDQNQACTELDIISGVCRSYCRPYVADIDHYTCKCKSGFTGANCETITSADACTAQAQAQFGTNPGGRAVAQGSWDHVPAGCSIQSSQSGIDELWPGDPMSAVLQKRGTHGVAMRKCKLAKGSVDGPLSNNEKKWCMDRDYAYVDNGKLSSHSTKRTVGQPHFNTNKNPQNVDLNGFTPVYSDDHAVRARGGADVKEGVAFQPEMAIHGVWRPICAHWFDANNNGATQVCRQLGFGSGTVTRSGTLYKDAVFVGKCERGEGLGRCTGDPNNAKAWGHDSCTAGKAANTWVTCEPKKHCVFLHGAGACPMKFVDGKATPLTHNVHPYTHDMSPGAFVEKVTDGDFNGKGFTVTEGNVVAGPRFTNPTSSAVDRYWGDVHLYTPQCKTRTFIWENTLTRGWNEHSLQQSYCNAAASKGAPRDLSLLKNPDGSLYKLNDQPVAADRTAPLHRNALTLASAIANVAGVKQGLLHMVAQKFGVTSITTKQIAAQLPAADQDRDGDLSDIELGGAAAQMGMEDPAVAAALQHHFSIVLLPAQPVIEDTIVFTHSMGNNILSSALSKGVCKFGSRSSWYSVAGPMKGSAASKTVDQMCHSQKLRKWVKILAPAGSLDAMCIMTAREKCYPNMMNPLTPTGTTNWHYNPNCPAPGAEADNNNYHKGRRTWRSLMPEYSPTEESAARNAMQAEPALKATVCGSQGLGQGVGQALGMKRLGCFFTRNRNPASTYDSGKCRLDYKWSSNGENDGAVTVDSCKAATRPGWSTHTGLTHNKAEMWVTPQNHEDLTCRNGDYKRACTWYGLAQ